MRKPTNLNIRGEHQMRQRNTRLVKHSQKPLDPRVRSALKQARTGNLARGLSQLAQRVVTDLNDDGDVVKTISVPGDGKKIAFSETVAVQGPGWVAARAFPATSSTWWGQPDVAHTSPIYIRSGDQRLVRPGAARNLIHVLQAGKGSAQASEMYESAAQKQAVLDYYERGIALFEDLVDSAQGTDVPN